MDLVPYSVDVRERSRSVGDRFRSYRNASSKGPRPSASFRSVRAWTSSELHGDAGEIPTCRGLIPRLCDPGSRTRVTRPHPAVHLSHWRRRNFSSACRHGGDLTTGPLPQPKSPQRSEPQPSPRTPSRTRPRSPHPPRLPSPRRGRHRTWLVPRRGVDAPLSGSLTPEARSEQPIRRWLVPRRVVDVPSPGLAHSWMRATDRWGPTMPRPTATTLPSGSTSRPTSREKP